MFSLPISRNGAFPTNENQSTELGRRRPGAKKRQRNSARDELLAVVAHELRGSLYPILAAAAYLARTHVDGEQSDQAAIAVIERQVTHLARLINDLSDASRVTFGKMRLHFEEVSLATVITLAVEANRYLIDREELRLRILLPLHDVKIMGDMTRLTQVFGNILNNAVKFSNFGGAIEVRVSSENLGQRVAVSVRDEGAGISADIIGSVFNLFAQAKPTSSQNSGGLGIGLSIVRSITEMHGGTVTVFSEGVSKGSEFVVTLPTTSSVPVGLNSATASSPPIAVAESVHF